MTIQVHGDSVQPGIVFLKENSYTLFCGRVHEDFYTFSTELEVCLTSRRTETSLAPMRTTLDIPEALLEEARHLLGAKSKTDTVVFALQELVRRKRIEELKSLFGAIDLQIDIPKSRRRS